MPKKYGKMKTYSFNEKTIEQMKYLSEVLTLKETRVLECLIDEEFFRVKNREKGNESFKTRKSK